MSLGRKLTNQEATHVSHCCKKHGCKYGYGSEEGSLCPVASGKLKQDPGCEWCDHEEQSMEERGEVWQYGIVSDYGVGLTEREWGGAIDQLQPGKEPPQYLKKDIKVVRRRVSEWEEFE